MPHVNVILLHSPEKVQGYLDEARRIVTELELDDELRVPAFQLAVQLLTANVPLIAEQQAVPLGMLAPSLGGRH